MLSTMTPELMEQIKALYAEGKSAMSIAALINRSETFVKYNLKKNGIAIRQVTAGLYRKYTLDTAYFDKIDTHEKAYWLGFLYADGYNHEKRNEVKLCLQIRDKEHIETFLKCIGSNQPIKQHACNIRGKSCQAVVCNSQFSDGLAKLGCYQDKSLSLRFPTQEQVPDEFMVSFMLGYFDGDGCITCLAKKPGNTSAFGVTSSFDFCTEYQNKLMNKCKLSKTQLYDEGYRKEAIRSHAWTLRYHGINNIKAIYDFLYSSPVTCYLKRKKDKFHYIFECHKNNKNSKVVLDLDNNMIAA